MSIKTRVLVTTGNGLIGKTLKYSKAVQSQNKFEFRYLESYIEKENISAIKKQVMDFSPEIIIHNAVKLPRGNQKNQVNLRLRNAETFQTVLDISETSSTSFVLAFTSYHVFNSYDSLPYKISNLVLDSTRHDTWYAQSKVDELILAQDFNRKSNLDKVKFVMLPHMFGIHDNFEDGKRHFIADMILKISGAKSSYKEFVSFSTNEDQFLQFLNAEDLITFLLGDYLVSIEEFDFITILNKGVVMRLTDIIKFAASTLEYSGKVLFSESEESDFFRSMYFWKKNEEKNVESFYNALRSLLTRYN
jgi:nucleoside-diphosphate-sugar epimerase